ncbi:acyltransferase family protein [Cocleimonas flava]|uniref:Peptidoglycan/LPS O-acetylase OafA/YrhL n=1 Tax=Cocleimonas flava TaxID=634765 RepID=A0A4V2P7Q5_9GAMM|nr:acyltransferase family protein [Cocleimonas flava]TCJ82715.1 peptidoglycan/LPS O-acetylase OafA/YrhL [Cocleimonas flava]
MKYRSEIDGLRAIAVLPVIFFHAGIGILSGGYVGVDVFFVISGFLITTIILSEIQQDSFSLANFYERRARRILPALFFVMLVSLPFAWMWLLPSDMKDFAKSLIAVSTFSSNILFWTETGYWEASSELKPMLHTWSLAVEEQYYIFFPLFLLIMWKIRKRWILSTVLLLALISLAASQWGAYNKPTANFFMLPTRLWELAIGALIALYLLKANTAFQPQKWVRETFGAIGLFMIAYAVFMFDETTPFPSVYTLVPTVGAGLVILFATSTTVVGRFLSTKLFVGVGLISYSIYLWHQPLLAFARHGSFDKPSTLVLFALVTLSIPLAYLSWRFIEKPFRTKGVFNRKQIFGLSATASAAFIAIGVSGVASNGFEQRAIQSNLTMDAIDKRWRVNAGLDLKCTETFNLSDECNTSDKPQIIIWGDSYAMHLVKGIMASKPDAKIIQMTKYVCGPFTNIAPIIEPHYPVGWAKECLDFNQQVQQWLVKNDSVKYAVLSSPFSQYLAEGSEVLLANGERAPANRALITKEFENTLEALVNIGIKPIVFSPPPANGINLGRCLTRADWKGKALDACNFNKDKMLDIRQTVYEFLDTIEDKYQVVRLDDYMCESQECNTHIDSTYLFRDEGHLSHEGTALLGKKYNFYETIVEKQIAERLITEPKLTDDTDEINRVKRVEVEAQLNKEGVVVLDALKTKKIEPESEVISNNKKQFERE